MIVFFCSFEGFDMAVMAFWKGSVDSGYPLHGLYGAKVMKLRYESFDDLSKECEA